MTPMPGTLFVVATPIGNLEDLTLRARRTLAEADLIAAEDTRRTAKLLAHYGMSRPTISLREHNEARETPRLLARLDRGERIALVSDAGTPGIADPGAKLVRAARERRIRVVPIPGPSAIMAALSVSGFPADEFVFMGFPPRSVKSRNLWFERLSSESRTVIAFEAPHRIRRTLQQASSLLVDRPIMIARELTKVHEQLVELPNMPSLIMSNDLSERGEFVLVIGPRAAGSAVELDAALVARVFEALGATAGVDPDLALSLTAKAFELPERTVRKAIKQTRIDVKRRAERET